MSHVEKTSHISIQFKNHYILYQISIIKELPKTQFS
jgi:hypothetical protein